MVCLPGQAHFASPVVAVKQLSNFAFYSTSLRSHVRLRWIPDDPSPLLGVAGFPVKLTHFKISPMKNFSRPYSNRQHSLTLLPLLLLLRRNIANSSPEWIVTWDTELNLIASLFPKGDSWNSKEFSRAEYRAHNLTEIFGVQVMSHGKFFFLQNFSTEFFLSLCVSKPFDFLMNVFKLDTIIK